MGKAGEKERKRAAAAKAQQGHDTKRSGTSPNPTSEDPSPTTSGLPDPTTNSAKPHPLQSCAPSSTSSRQNPPQSRSSSAALSSASRSNSTLPTIVDATVTKGSRQSHKTALQMSGDDHSNDNSNKSADNDNDDNDGSNKGLSDDPAHGSDSDIEIDDATFRATGELAIVAPSIKKPLSAFAPRKHRVSPQLLPDPPVDDEDDGDNEDEPFQMTFKIEDKAKGSRCSLVVLSTILWYDFQQKVAEILGIFPTKLQLQYRFSNENKSSLPFDLNCHTSFGSMCNKLRPFVVLPTLNNGKKSTRKMKVVTVALFNRNAEEEDCAVKKTSKTATKTPTSHPNSSSDNHDSMFNKKMAICERLLSRWHCNNHSLPNKPAACWKDADQSGVCFPLTIRNINYWILRIISDPIAFLVDVKPSQLNLEPSHRTTASRPYWNNIPQQPSMPMPMPYPYYLPPHLHFPQQFWPQAAPPPLHATNEHAAGRPMMVKGPAISSWLQYCDNHWNRKGENYVALAPSFDKQGYRTINQLTSSHVTVEKLLGWLNIGTGTADYIIQYADEDMRQVIDGKFEMPDLPDMDGPSNDW